MYPSSVTWDAFLLHDGRAGHGTVSMTVKNALGHDVPAFAVRQYQDGTWRLLVWSKVKQIHVPLSINLSTPKSKRNSLFYGTYVQAKMALEAIIPTWGGLLLEHH